MKNLSKDNWIPILQYTISETETFTIRDFTIWNALFLFAESPYGTGIGPILCMTADN